METDIDPAEAGHDEIRLLVGDVVESSKVPAKTRATSIKPTITNLTSLCYEWGLLPETLDHLINLVTTPNHLDQASQAAIIRNLYPVAPVSRESTLRVISCLGHGALKPSLTLQAALLKWLITVHHTLESPQVLSQVYPVLFNLLDTAATRPNLSHLLALITRRKHVRPFRIQALLNLSRQTGNDPCLIGLLRVFKDYYPEVIVGEAVRGKASSFKHPDPQWRERLDEIQEAHYHKSQGGPSQPRDGFRVHRPIGRSARNKVVPLVHTSHATEDAVTLEEIENATGFVKNLDKLELPNQLIAVLADPLLQKLMLLKPGYESEQRISNWLNAVLQDVHDGDADEATFFDMLDILRDYVVSVKHLPPLLLNFFVRFLPLWDGSGRRDSMFEILSYSPLLDFQELYKHVLQPLEAATLDNTPESQLALLALYKNLLHHWTVVLGSSDPVPDNASGSVTALVRHVNTLTLSLVQTSTSVSARSAILDFYEQNARLVSHETLKHHIRIELPPSFLIYILFFGSSAAITSRICAILALYKKGFEMAMFTKPRRDGSNRVDSSSYNKVFVSLFNGYLMDICNCFWRGRAFTDSDPNAHGCMIPRSLVPKLSSYVVSVEKTHTLTSLFSLSYSPLLCLQSTRCIQDLESSEIDDHTSLRVRHEGPPTQSSLGQLASSGGIRVSWQDYRIKVLETLSAKELAGITDLLKNTMTVLRKLIDGEGNTKPTATQ
ncbi:Mis6-domain-containing protein [Fusarium avenaceum]|nr:Mis6-domain-containing protein [Fusarium avenaceum]